MFSVGAIQNLERSPQTQTPEPKKENSADKSARFTMYATIAIAAFTIVLAWTSYKTLKEIHDGGVDTHNLAEAAISEAQGIETVGEAGRGEAAAAFEQANRTKDLADRMKDQADRTKTIAEQAVIQAESSKAIAAENGKAVTIAGQQLDSSERPWMKVNLVLNGPVTIDAFGLHVPIMIDAKNTGKSPAMKVRAQAELIPYGSVSSMDKSQQRICDGLKAVSEVGFARDILGIGDTVFPDDPYRIAQNPTMNPQTIKSELERPSSGQWIDPNGKIVDFGTGDTGQGVGPLLGASFGMVGLPSISITGCMDYSIDYSGVRKQTMFLFHLQGIDLRKSDGSHAVIGRSYGRGNGAT